MRFSAFLLLLLVFWPFSSAAFSLEGHLIQGGMAIGRTEPTAAVFFKEKRVRVSPEGLFIIGFSRNAPPSVQIEIRQADGSAERHAIQIEARTYEIQHIDGLPQRKVTPSAEDLNRIKEEIALVKAVRREDHPRTDFSRSFIWPVIGRISGVYGSQRVLNGKPRRPHYGVDIAAPTGTPVKAPADGVVALTHQEMFFSGGTLLLDHGHGLSTSYLHLHKILVREGQGVKQGDVIAQVGATGRVTGPHLHWGMNWFGVRLDPALLVPPMPLSPKRKSGNAEEE